MSITISAEIELSAVEVAEKFASDPDFLFDVMGALAGLSDPKRLVEEGYCGSLYHQAGAVLLRDTGETACLDPEVS